MLKKLLINLGQYGLDCLSTIGQWGLCLGQLLKRLFSWQQGPPLLRYSARLLVEQLYFIGFKSLGVVSIAGVFIGAVLTLQAYASLAQVGALHQLSPLVAWSVLRELGPVVTGLLFAGRAGSALTAEIGLIKTTEQLASLEMMGVDPIGYVIAPRFWASFYAFPLLSLVFSVLAIIGGGYGIAVIWCDIGEGVFWGNLHENISFWDDIIKGLIKSFIFGWIISWIAVFQGYQTATSPDGIAKATTKTVVYASLAVLALDVLLTAMMW